jgi:phosphatidylglycerophosphatase C
MHHIAIYDLDKTILRTPTFTAFLMFATQQRGGSLWWRLPFWGGAMAGYVLKLYGRKPLKQFGMRLFISKVFTASQADDLSRAFAAKLVPGDVLPGAAAAMQADRAAGYRIVIASAAQAFYAEHIGAALGADAVLATQNQRTAGGFTAKIDGENNYGAEKLRRVISWLSAQGLDRSECHISAYSDHISDAPLLDFADEAVFVTASDVKAAAAQSRGWQVRDFSI